MAAPTLPAEAKAADPDGAAAFIRHYFDAVNFAYSTGDLGPVTSLRDADCAACATLERRIEDAYSSDSHIEGAHIVVGEVTPTPGDFSKGADIRAILRQDAGKVLSRGGDVVDEIPAQSERLGRFVLDWQDEWVLVQWGSSDAS